MEEAKVWREGYNRVRIGIRVREDYGASVNLARRSQGQG